MDCVYYGLKCCINWKNEKNNITGSKQYPIILAGKKVKNHIQVLQRFTFDL